MPRFCQTERGSEEDGAKLGEERPPSSEEESESGERKPRWAESRAATWEVYKYYERGRTRGTGKSRGMGRVVGGACMHRMTCSMIFACQCPAPQISSLQSPQHEAHIECYTATLRVYTIDKPPS